MRVALVHGSLDRGASLAEVAAALDGLEGVDGVDVVTPDRAGYGRRVDERPASSIAEAARDLLAVLGGGPAVAVGHSYGGHVAIAAAIQQPGVVRAVGAFETPLGWLDWWPPDTSGGKALTAARTGGAAAAVEAFVRSMIGDDGWSSLPERTRQARIAEGDALVADLQSMTDPAHPPYDLAQLAVPLVVGRSERAQPHQAKGTRWLADAVAGAELVVVGDAAHDAHRRNPRAFASAFVERVVSYART